VDLTLKLKSLPAFTLHELFYAANGDSAIALDYAKRQIAHLTRSSLSTTERQAVNVRVSSLLDYDKEYVSSGYLSRKIRLHSLLEEELAKAGTTLRLNSLDDISIVELLESGVPISTGEASQALDGPGEMTLLQRVGTHVATKIGAGQKPREAMTSVAVCILFQSEIQQRFTIDFLKDTTERDSEAHRTALQGAQQLHSAVLAGLQQKPASHAMSVPPYRDTLHKLSKLHHQGLLTKEEIHLLTTNLRTVE